MANQLELDLRPAHVSGVLRFDAGFAIAWRKLTRRARRIFASTAQSPDALRYGFALMRHAEDTALLEALRAQLSGKRIKQAARHSGRMPVKAAVLFAMSAEGRRLHVLVDQMEERLAGREAVTLCG